MGDIIKLADKRHEQLSELYAAHKFALANLTIAHVSYDALIVAGSPEGCAEGLERLCSAQKEFVDAFNALQAATGGKVP